MLTTKPALTGYMCAPYMHDHASIELKEHWANSKNIEGMYFVTATFSAESKPYFSSPTSHYILAKFRNDKEALEKIAEQELKRAMFVFCIDDELFERDASGEVNFVSIYYLGYTESHDDINDVASVVVRRERIGKAGIGHMDICSAEPQKFTFPYSNNIVVLEVSSEKSHQSMNKYCEKTRRDVNRKGITMTNLVSLSILERMK